MQHDIRDLINHHALTVSEYIDDGTAGVVRIFGIARAGAVDIKLSKYFDVNAVLFANY